MQSFTHGYRGTRKVRRPWNVITATALGPFISELLHSGCLPSPKAFEPWERRNPVVPRVPKRKMGSVREWWRTENRLPLTRGWVHAADQVFVLAGVYKTFVKLLVAVVVAGYPILRAFDIQPHTLHVYTVGVLTGSIIVKGFSVVRKICESIHNMHIYVTVVRNIVEALKLGLRHSHTLGTETCMHAHPCQPCWQHPRSQHKLDRRCRRFGNNG